MSQEEMMGIEARAIKSDVHQSGEKIQGQDPEQR